MNGANLNCFQYFYRICRLSGSLYIYEQGFLYIHPRAGAILLPTSNLSKVQFYDKVYAHVICNLCGLFLCFAMALRA